MDHPPHTDNRRPLIVIADASGDLGRSLRDALAGAYYVVGFDRAAAADSDVVEMDPAHDVSVEQYGSWDCYLV